MAYGVFSQLGRHNNPFASGDLLILTYHRVLPSDDARALTEQPGMMVTPDTFEMHLEELDKKFEMVRLCDWLENVRAKKALPRRACAITFDDGWRDNYEFAFPVLKKKNVPASLFLVSNMIGTRSDFWPGNLTRVLQAITKRDPGSLMDAELKPVRDIVPEVYEQEGAISRQVFDRIIEGLKQHTDTENENYVKRLQDKYQVVSSFV